jgi:hypothetical protein
LGSPNRCWVGVRDPDHTHRRFGHVSALQNVRRERRRLELRKLACEVEALKRKHQLSDESISTALDKFYDKEGRLNTLPTQRWLRERGLQALLGFIGGVGIVWPVLLETALRRSPVFVMALSAAMLLGTVGLVTAVIMNPRRPWDALMLGCGAGFVVAATAMLGHTFYKLSGM